MLRKYRVRPLVFIFLGLLIAACGRGAETPIEVTETIIPPTNVSTITPIPTEEPPTIPADTPIPTITLTATETLVPPPSATATQLPAGFKVVPSVVGLHYLDARQVLLNAGFTFLYSDVFELDQPFGTILEQYPVAGSVEKTGETIFLYRAFQAPGMWVGDKCRQLLITTTSGKLLFGVYLREGDVYEIKTDFRYGKTSIFDYRMVLLDSFKNQEADYLIFEPEWTAWYVLSLGPYEVSQSELDKYPDGVPSGCLWVHLLEE
ncbi:MAG: hypothetical protein AMJ88_18490 [Anaerolineae bacterium SM23_ 63]|nr:MAG: hypothetical protein AMJ88_18490 [Anaerolineae bacterium SM23_ 63]